ncbi:MAG: hypothetical protein ABI831_16495 [Betaproteobacteria bacterium]
MISPYRSASLMRTLCALFCCAAGSLWAQTTAFTYEGKLTDAGSPANGNYELQFTIVTTGYWRRLC